MPLVAMKVMNYALFMSPIYTRPHLAKSRGRPSLKPPHQSAAMTLARERGANYARAQYDDPNNLSLLEAGKHAGLAVRIINERRNAGRYYALALDGKSRGFRYPSWQFDAESTRLTPVLDILREANASCWAIHHFMQIPDTQLDGLTPRDWILDATRDATRVINAARARFASDQGAE
jgi:hypothetical protein